MKLIVIAPETSGILGEVAEERDNQDDKWGEVATRLTATADRWHTILSEEVGEVADAINEGDVTGMRAELIQVAAVAVATIEALDAGGAALR